MAGGLQWIDGRMQYVGGDQGSAAPFFNQEVPGAAQGAPQVDVTAPVTQAMGAVAEEQITAQEGELTEREKAEQEAVKKQRAAEIQRKKAETEALKAEHAALDAGVPDAVSGADANLPAAQPVQPSAATNTEGLVNEGFNGQKAAVETQGQLVDQRESELAIAGATIGQQRVQDAQILQDASDAEAARLAQRSNDLAARIQENVKRDVKPPTPSALNLLGVFLSGLVSRDGRNPAMDILNTRMQREADIEIQNRSSELAALRTEQGALVDESARSKQEFAAKSVLMAQKLEGVSQFLQAKIDAGTLGPTALAAAQKQLGEIKVQQGDWQMKARNAAEQLALQADKQAQELALKTAKANRGGPGKIAKPQMGLRDAAKELGIPDDKLDQLALLPVFDKGGKTKNPGFIAAASPQIVKEFNQTATRYERGLEEMGEIARMTQLPGVALSTPVGSTDLGAKLSTRYTNFLLQMKEITNLGVLNGADLKVLKDITGMSRTDIQNLTPQAILNNLGELYDITARDLSTRVDRLSLGQSEFKYPSWSTVSKGLGNARGMTNNEVVIQAKDLAERSSGELSNVEKAKNHTEANLLATQILDDGISTANIADAEAVLEAFDKIPKSVRRKAGDPGTDPHLKLSTAVANWKNGDQTKTQETVEKRQKDAKAKAAKRKALEEARLKAGRRRGEKPKPWEALPGEK